MKILSRLIPVFVVMLLVSCTTKSVKFPQAHISPEEQIDVEVNRFDLALFAMDQENFQEELLAKQEQFGPLLAADLSDTSNVNQLLSYVQDTQIISIYEKTREIFPNSIWLNGALSEGFTRYHHYFPQVNLPDVFTYVSDMFFEQPIVFVEGSMIVAIDLYLDPKFPLYLKLGLPYYKIKWMQPKSLPVDVMKALYFQHLKPSAAPKTLLDRMIEMGKILAYLDAVLPETDDEFKISYTPEQLNWAQNNETDIWAFLVSNKLLYTTDYQSQTKLIQDGPFTTGFSNDSPSRLGVYMGWQIVNAFLKNNPEVTMEQLINNTDAQDILQRSGYKPR